VLVVDACHSVGAVRAGASVSFYRNGGLDSTVAHAGLLQRNPHTLVVGEQAGGNAFSGTCISLAQSGFRSFVWDG
jgi:hypothetical protein